MPSTTTSRLSFTKQVKITQRTRPIMKKLHYYLVQNYIHPRPSLVIKTFSTKEITSTIKALKTKWKKKNFYGFGETSIKLLILVPLMFATHICDMSISSGIFADHMKFSIIKPIYRVFHNFRA